MAEIPPGRYAYRFSGFSMAPDDENPFALVGLGLITVDEDGLASGFHQATSTILTGFEAKPTIRRYGITGTIEAFEAEMKKARITFTSPEQTMTGVLALVPAGPGRFWLISQEAKIKDGPAADEVVSGEFVRLDPPV